MLFKNHIKQHYHIFLILFLTSLLLPSAVAADLEFVLDDQGHKFSIETPARRIISLAPHITEMLFSADAGQYIVGTVSYSD